MQDLNVLFHLTEEGKTRTSDWKWKLGKFQQEIRQKYLTLRVINLWETVGSAHFSISCYLLIKAEVSWEEMLPLLQDLLWASVSNHTDPYRNTEVKQCPTIYTASDKN